MPVCAHEDKRWICSSITQLAERVMKALDLVPLDLSKGASRTGIEEVMQQSRERMKLCEIQYFACKP